MINHFGYPVCHKALQLSFTASMAWHCNPFAFKHGREQEGRTVISKYTCPLLCPSSFTDFPLDSYQEFQEHLKSTLSKQFHGRAEPARCPKERI